MMNDPIDKATKMSQRYILAFRLKVRTKKDTKTIVVEIDQYLNSLFIKITSLQRVIKS